MINAGLVRAPQFGYIFLEKRPASQRRPKLVDGLDWVPSSAANASTRLLQDGVTELVRYYCARRTKADVARPHAKTPLHTMTMRTSVALRRAIPSYKKLLPTM